MKPHTHTDEQVRAMLHESVYWLYQLRQAARERGFAGSSVTPIGDVIAWLRVKVKP